MGEKNKFPKKSSPFLHAAASSGDDHANIINGSTLQDRPRRKRIIFFLLRLIFLWIPLLSIVIPFLSIVAANMLLTPPVVESIIKTRFNRISNGTISLKVTQFKLYQGFVIENIAISNPEEFGKGNILEIEKLVVRHGIFNMLAGNIRFDEIGIYKPRVYLKQKNGVWNIERLMKPAEGEPEKEEKPSTKTEIDLPIRISLFINFILDDLRVFVRGDDFKTDCDGLSFTCRLNVPPTKKIPLSPLVASLISDLDISLNPGEKIDFSFYSPDASVEPPLILSWRLLYGRSSVERNNFASSFRFGTYKTPVRFRRTHLAPLNFLVAYDLYYDPARDHLRVNDFSVRSGDDRWLSLAGSVKNTTKDAIFELSMKRSEISLTGLYPYYRALTGDESMVFSGKCSLYPLTIQGPLQALRIRGNITMASIAVKVPDFEIAVPALDLGYGLDMRGSRGKIRAKLSVPRFTYKLDRSPSGMNALLLNAEIDTADNFARFIINNIDVGIYDPRGGEKALTFGVRGALDMTGVMKGDITVHNLVFKRDGLVTMLPEQHAKTVAGLPFVKPVGASMHAIFSLGEPLRASLAANCTIPDFNVPDLELKGDIAMHAKKSRIDISGIRIGSRTRGIAVNIKGFVETAKSPISDSDLSIDMALEYPSLTRLYGPLSLSGSVRILASMKGDLSKGFAKGSVKIANLSLKNSETLLSIEKVNLDFPYEYNFAYRPSVTSRLAVDKNTLFENQFFREKENFSIASISAKHPSREIEFTYLENMKGILFFRNNSFDIQELRATLLDGTLHGKNIFFYLSDLKKRNMEYRLIIDAANIDVGLIDNPDRKRKTRETELSFNADISGRGLEFSEGMNVNGSVNIYTIGRRFANRLMRGLSQEKGKSKLGIAQPVIDNLEIPRAFYYYIDNGIMYTDVAFKKRILGYVVSIRDDRIKFDRVPIQEYLKKVQE
jgi:hypothetical protein